MSVPASVFGLVERFSRGRRVFLSGVYTVEQLPKTKMPHEQESIRRQIVATDKQIDQPVYELYGLTEEEIKIVEGTGVK